MTWARPKAKTANQDRQQQKKKGAPVRTWGKKKKRKKGVDTPRSKSRMKQEEFESLGREEGRRGVYHFIAKKKGGGERKPLMMRKKKLAGHKIPTVKRV